MQEESAHKSVKVPGFLREKINNEYCLQEPLHVLLLNKSICFSLGFPKQE